MTPNDVVLRFLRPSEFANASSLKRRVLVDTFTPRVTKLSRLLEWQNRKAVKTHWPKRATIGAFRKGRLIGVAAYTPKNGKTFDKISDLWVEQIGRGQGVGGQLLRSAENKLRQQGTRVARLTTPLFNASAVAFYKAHGWRVERITLHRTLFYLVVRFKKRLNT